MNYTKYVCLLATMAFALSLSAFAKDAKDTDSGSFTLDSPTEVGTTQLAAGHYKAAWSGPANAVKVDILQHGKTVATAEGQIKDLPNPAPYDAVTVKPMANNSSQKALHEIDFNHRTEALVFGGE
jgi:hypothetical protein